MSFHSLWAAARSHKLLCPSWPGCSRSLVFADAFSKVGCARNTAIFVNGLASLFLLPFVNDFPKPPSLRLVDAYKEFPLFGLSA